jgi:hypothetical protein
VRSAVVLVMLVVSTAVASADQAPRELETEQRAALGMRHMWGRADGYEFTGRYEYAESTEWSDFLASLEVGAGSVGGRTAYLVGASAEMLMLHNAGLGVGVQLLRATDDATDVHFFARGSIGLRIHGVEVSYAYQRQLGGDRYDWMASHMLVVGLHVPLRFDL